VRAGVPCRAARRRSGELGRRYRHRLGRLLSGHRGPAGPGTPAGAATSGRAMLARPLALHHPRRHRP
jgi:hypothetical protein